MATYPEELVNSLLDPITQNPSLQYKTKVHEKTILLDDKPVDYGERKAARLEKKRKRAARKGLPRSVTREMFRKVPPEMVNWEMCLELHYLWKEYIVDLLDLKPDQHNYANLSAINDKLTRCDFHGALLNIIQSRVPTNIGKSGIVVKETENMFYLVTRESQLLAMKKENQIFGVQVTSEYYAQLFGNNLRIRTGDRTTKKLKVFPNALI